MTCVSCLGLNHFDFPVVVIVRIRPVLIEGSLNLVDYRLNNGGEFEAEIQFVSLV